MRLLRLWGPVALYMALIFAASAQPDLGPLPGGVSDKTGHVVAYAGLAVLLLRALAGGKMADVTYGRAALAWLLATLYGVSDELHQRFVPGRTSDGLDVAADALGAFAGVAFVLVFKRLRDAARGERRYS